MKKSNINRKYIFKKKAKMSNLRRSISFIDYKVLFTIKKFINKSYKIISSKISKTNKLYQRKIRKNIIYARFLSLIPYTYTHKI